MIVGLILFIIGILITARNMHSKIAWAFVVVGLVLIAWPAQAQEHRGHPPEHQALHEKFYSTWMMPDNRAVSCCHKEDCSPAESRIENGHWMARKVGEQGDFTPIPDQKIETERDNPDGRSHLCGQRYNVFNGGGFTVFCFMLGNGT